jgi:hypothetical protein
MSESPWQGYHFAVLRVVPHVYRAEFVNVGVVLHSREAEFLGMRAVFDPPTLAALAPETDVDILARYLECFLEICNGNPAAGEIALLSPPERFHWLSAPRSDLLQSSPVHEGITLDPARTLEDLFAEFVKVPLV